MYVCPTCGKEISSKDKIAKHFLKCWKELHPNHISKEAPRSADIETREVSNDIMNFFNSFKE